MLHIGGLRTALYNYLFARHHGGTFVLRIEDTDRERFVAEAETDILDSMRWAGLDIDEGPEEGGDYEPYRQSERSDLYREIADLLIEQGHAYIAFDTPQALDRLREQNEGTARYDASTRKSMTNSLTLSREDVQRRIDDREPYVVRLKVPEKGSVQFEDIVRGSVTFDMNEIDDQVLLKSDGLPTYHLANVVDDHLMQITHVIRGEEWLPSTPKHILLYRFLGWQAPRMAHLPLILSSTGGKLSKRNAEEAGIPVSVKQYRDAGYEPEALLNFLAFLGWNPGDERELFSVSELADAFTLDRVGSSGVKFSMDKLNWFNEQHLRSFAIDDLLERARPSIEKEGLPPDDDRWPQIAGALQERISRASDLPVQARVFFQAPSEYDETGVKKRWKADSGALLRAYADLLEAQSRFDAGVAESTLKQFVEDEGIGVGKIMAPLRLAISGATAGPDLYEMMELIGKDESLSRIGIAVDRLSDG
jgi:glutamyl-tRNA synthetase